MPPRTTFRSTAPWDRTWEDWESPYGGGGRPQGPVGWANRLRRLLLRWPVVILLVFAVAGGIATDITRPAGISGRLADLRAYYATEQTGISSCSGGLHDSLVAFQAIVTGQSTDRTTAESIAVAGSQACSPSSNGDLYDMASAVPPRTLMGYGLERANTALYDWAFPATARVQLEIEVALKAHALPGSPQLVQLGRDLRAVHAQGVQVQDMFTAVATRLHGTLSPLNPPIDAAPPSFLG